MKEVIGGCELYLADCIEILPRLGAVNAVITDPPYTLSTASSGTKNTFLADITNTAYFFADILKKEAGLLTGGGGVIWQFCNWKTLPALQKAAFDNDMKIESVLVWDKGLLGAGSLAGLRPCYELAVLICVNGGKIENRSLPDLWKVQWKSNRAYHPAEKPVALMEKIIKETSGGIILDPFMGSGTTGVACVRQGRRFIGVELERRYFDIACRRIKEAVFAEEARQGEVA
jgi:DNA modification methylase